MRCRLCPERLEGRDVPAVTIRIDYSVDAPGVFNDPARRAVLEQAAADLGAHLDSPLAAITPGGGNDWVESFINPATGQTTRVSDPVVGANEVVVYVGARDLSGAAAGETGLGQASASG